MYLRLAHQVEHVQNMFPDRNSFLHLSVHVATSSFMMSQVILLPKHGLERFPYLICSLHVLMLLPNNIVHASKHVTTSFVVGMNPTIISFSYSTRSISRGSGGHSLVRTNFWFSQISTILMFDFHLTKLSLLSFSLASKAIMGLFDDMIVEIK